MKILRTCVLLGLLAFVGVGCKGKNYKQPPAKKPQTGEVLKKPKLDTGAAIKLGVKPAPIKPGQWFSVWVRERDAKGALGRYYKISVENDALEIEVSGFQSAVDQPGSSKDYSFNLRTKELKDALRQTTIPNGPKKVLIILKTMAAKLENDKNEIALSLLPGPAFGLLRSFSLEHTRRSIFPKLIAIVEGRQPYTPLVVKR